MPPSELSLKSSKESTDWRVKAGIGAIGGSIVLISLLAAPFLLVPASKKLGSLPWMATPNQAIRRALHEVSSLQQSNAGMGKKSLKIVDLGSVDGRLCILAAKEFGYSAVGVELNPVLIGLSYYNAWKAGKVASGSILKESSDASVPSTSASTTAAAAGTGTGTAAGTGMADTPRVLSRVQFRMQDFWSVPLHTFDVIAVFGVRSIMARLESKLAEEAQSDELHVVCYRFPLPNKQPVYAKDELFIYRFSHNDPPLVKKAAAAAGALGDQIATLYK